MLKKDTLGNASAKSLDEAFKCGECLHFKGHVHPAHKKPCKDEGIRAFAVAPKCFTPDVTQLQQNSDQFVTLAALLANYTPKQKRIMMAVLRNAPKKGKDRMAFGTKVYFHALGKEYISNYLSGYFLGFTSSGDLIISGSPEQGSRGRSYIAMFKTTETLLTHSEWVVRRAYLKEHNKIIDPNGQIIVKSPTQDGEPPSLDEAPAAWHDKRDTQLKKRSRNAELEFRVS